MKKSKTIRSAWKIVLKELPKDSPSKYPYIVTGPKFLDPSGQKRRWRRFFRIKAEALAYMDQRAIAVTNLGASAPELGQEALHAVKDCISSIQSLGIQTSLADVMCAGLNVLRMRQASQRIGLSLSDFIAKKNDEAANGLMAKQSVRLLHNFCLKFVQSIGPERYLSDVCPDEIRDYLRTIEGAPKTRWHHHVAIRMFFRHAEIIGLLEKSPMTNVPTPRLSSPAPKVFTPEFVSKFLHSVLKHTPEHLGYYVLSFFCGIRRAELLRLTWDAVDLADGYVYLPAKLTKTGSGRLVKLAGCARSWLELCQKGTKIATGGKKALLMKMRLLKKESGLTATWIRNGARHSFVSYHYAMCENAYETASQAGHDVRILARHYRAIVTRAEAARYWSIFPPETEINVTPFHKFAEHIKCSGNAERRSKQLSNKAQP